MRTCVHAALVLASLLAPVVPAQAQLGIIVRSQILDFLPNGGILVHIHTTTKEGCEAEKEGGRVAMQFNTDPGYVVVAPGMIPAANMENLAIPEEQFDWSQGCLVIFQTRPIDAPTTSSPRARG